MQPQTTQTPVVEATIEQVEHTVVTIVRNEAAAPPAESDSAIDLPPARNGFTSRDRYEPL